MSFTSYFSPSIETRELHTDPQLRTRYYRNTFTQVLEALKEYAAKEYLEVKNVNNVHGEIYLLGPGFDCITTAIQITPIETSVDFKINFFTAMGLGRPKKQAILLFKYLDSVLKFKGVALHP